MQTTRRITEGDIFRVDAGSTLTFAKYVPQRITIPTDGLLLVLCRGTHGWIVATERGLAEADLESCILLGHVVRISP